MTMSSQQLAASSHVLCGPQPISLDATDWQVQLNHLKKSNKTQDFDVDGFQIQEKHHLGPGTWDIYVRIYIYI